MFSMCPCVKTLKDCCDFDGGFLLLASETGKKMLWWKMRSFSGTVYQQGKGRSAHRAILLLTAGLQQHERGFRATFFFFLFIEAGLRTPSGGQKPINECCVAAKPREGTAALLAGAGWKAGCILIGSRAL